MEMEMERKGITMHKCTDGILCEVVDYVEIWFDSYMNRWVITANNKAGFDVGDTKYSPYNHEAIELALYHWKGEADVLVANRDYTDCMVIVDLHKERLERKNNV